MKNDELKKYIEERIKSKYEFLMTQQKNKDFTNEKRFFFSGQLFILEEILEILLEK